MSTWPEFHSCNPTRPNAIPKVPYPFTNYSIYDSVLLFLL